MAAKVKEKFKINLKMEIRPYSLGNRTKNLTGKLVDDDNGGTSMFRRSPGNNSTFIPIPNAPKMLDNIRKVRTQNGIIDMLTINCEGCEFEVLPKLTLHDMLRHFRMIQFASIVRLNKLCTERITSNIIRK